jgi:hypothetical protein
MKKGQPNARRLFRNKMIAKKFLSSLVMLLHCAKSTLIEPRLHVDECIAALRPLWCKDSSSYRCRNSGNRCANPSGLGRSKRGRGGGCEGCCQGSWPIPPRKGPREKSTCRLPSRFQEHADKPTHILGKTTGEVQNSLNINSEKTWSEKNSEFFLWKNSE